MNYKELNHFCWLKSISPELALFLGIWLLHANHKMVLVWAMVLLALSAICSFGMGLALELTNRFNLCE